MANHHMKVGTGSTTANSVLKLVASGISHETRDLITQRNGYNLRGSNMAGAPVVRYRLRTSN